MLHTVKQMVWFTVMLLAVSVTPLRAAEPVRIGAFLAVTGSASYLGMPELNMLRLQIEKLNARGGVLGRPLELIYYDTRGKAGEARKAVKRLIHHDRVDLLIGGTTSGSSMAVIPLVERAQIPFISLAGATAIIKPVKPWVFKTPHTDRMAVARVFNDMHTRGLKRVALISGSGGFGKSGRRQALDLAASYEIEVIADESYGPGALQIDQQLRRIFNSRFVDAVFAIGFGEGPVMVTRELRKVNNTVPLYQSHGVASSRFIELAGPAAEGIRLPAAGMLVSDQLSAETPQGALMIRLKAEYWKRYGSDASPFAGYAYDALMLAVQALRDAQTVNPFAVRRALEQIRGYTGTAGVINMSAEDHLGLSLDAFRMLEIRDGHWALLDN